MHLVACMRCGEEADILYYSRNPDWLDWELCAHCVIECDAEIETDNKEKQKEGEME